MIWRERRYMRYSMWKKCDIDIQIDDILNFKVLRSLFLNQRLCKIVEKIKRILEWVYRASEFSSDWTISKLVQRGATGAHFVHDFTACPVTAVIVDTVQSWQPWGLNIGQESRLTRLFVKNIPLFWESHWWFTSSNSHMSMTLIALYLFFIAGSLWVLS